jgi:hypothetical protein
MHISRSRAAMERMQAHSELQFYDQRIISHSIESQRTQVALTASSSRTVLILAMAMVVASQVRATQALEAEEAVRCTHELLSGWSALFCDATFLFALPIYPFNFLHAHSKHPQLYRQRAARMRALMNTALNNLETFVKVKFDVYTFIFLEHVAHKPKHYGTLRCAVLSCRFKPLALPLKRNACQCEWKRCIPRRCT